jgi:carbamoyl-phosphate synthase large subunit
VKDRNVPRHVAAKECVFPFKKLSGADTILGPEMRSTGEVMGIGETAARAYGKALRGIGANVRPPATHDGGLAFLSVTSEDRSVTVEIARRLRAIGFAIVAEGETAKTLAASRIPHRRVDGMEAARKALEESALAVITAEGDVEVERTRVLRRATLAHGITCFTTVALARAGCSALEEDDARDHVRALQDWYARE